MHPKRVRVGFIARSHNKSTQTFHERKKLNVNKTLVYRYWRANVKHTQNVNEPKARTHTCAATGMFSSEKESNSKYFESPSSFELTRVDCIYISQNYFTIICSIENHSKLLLSNQSRFNYLVIIVNTYKSPDSDQSQVLLTYFNNLLQKYVMY